MLRKLSAFAAIFYIGSCFAAETDSIGSVVVQGDLWMDGHPVQGSGTVFDGTWLETGSEPKTISELRLNNGTKITLHRSSSGTVYRGHFVLVRGEAEAAATGSYRVEIGGLAIKPSEPRTSETIAIAPGGDVSVMAQTGQIQIAGTHGQVLAQIRPQESQAFTRNSGGDWQIGAASRHAGDHGHDGDKDGHDGDDWDHDHRHHHHSR